MAQIEGGCMCGKIRFKLTTAPIHQTNCHCADCRRAVGAQAVAWVTVPKERFVVTQGNPKPFISSPKAARTFCENCGTSLTYTNIDRPNDIDITTGSLDKPEAFPPNKDVFPRERLHWVTAVMT